MKQDNTHLVSLMLMLRECLECYTDNIAEEVQALDDNEFAADPKAACMKVMEKAYATMKEEYETYMQVTGPMELEIQNVSLDDLTGGDEPPPLPRAARKDSGLH